MSTQVHRLKVAFLAALMLGYASAGKAASPHPAGPAWARNLPIYETALELSTPNGKFHEFEQRLDALKDLGVGIIWFLPIFPRGGNPPDKPPSNSAYCVRDYYDVNPAHGTKEEFKHLVAAGGFTEVFTAESKDLATAELDLGPWGYKLFLRGTSENSRKGFYGSH